MENPFWFDAGGPLTVPLFFARGGCLTLDYADFTDFIFSDYFIVKGYGVICGVGCGGSFYFFGEMRKAASTTRYSSVKQDSTFIRSLPELNGPPGFVRASV